MFLQKQLLSKMNKNGYFKNVFEYKRIFIYYVEHKN